MDKAEQIEKIIDALKEDADELFYKTRTESEKQNIIKWMNMQVEVLKYLLEDIK